MSKKHLIKGNPNLTDEQKLEIITVLNKYPDYENKVDWNKNKSLTYEDFYNNILRPLYLKELNFKGLMKGRDYDIIYENPSKKETLYIVKSYEASKVLASNNYGPKIWSRLPSWCGKEEFTDEAHAFGSFDSKHEGMKPGAKWCISMQTSDRYWNQYKESYIFLFWFRESDRPKDINKKIVIGLGKRNLSLYMAFNGEDKSYLSSIPQSLRNVLKEYKDKIREASLPQLILNPLTGRYDCNTSLDADTLSYFIAPSKGGFTINFGVVKGDFDCSWKNLTSLKGAPIVVEGKFDCSYNNLTSLEGAPRRTGYFDCHSNSLISLQGAPYRVQSINCSFNKLNTLEGLPQEIESRVNCSYNKLTSLKGLPLKLEGVDCSYNELTTLEGAPVIVKDFHCIGNKLVSLKGAPKLVSCFFSCCFNETLTSLEGLEEVDYYSIDCSSCGLTSLKGSPKLMKGYFKCSDNKFTTLEGAPAYIGKDFDCSSNKNLISLKGAPTVVRGDFVNIDCRKLKSLEGIGEVGGRIHSEVLNLYKEVNFLIL